MNPIIDEIQRSNLSELTKLKLLTALGEDTVDCLFTVKEDESGVPLADYVNFITSDARPNSDMSSDGFGTIELSDERVLFVDAYGIYDASDLAKGEDGEIILPTNSPIQAAYVSWNEFSQLLDQCRQRRIFSLTN